MPLAQEMASLYEDLSSEFSSRGIRGVRCFGGFACWLHSFRVRSAFEARPYMDLDLFADPSVGMSRIEPILKRLGFVRKERDPHGAGLRYQFLRRHSMHCSLDVYQGSWQFNHRLTIGDPLENGGLQPLSASDLLLSKLQIHEPMTKDLNDIAMLLADHDFGHGYDVIEESHVANACCADWGLERDALENLSAATETARATSQLPREIVQVVEHKAQILARAIKCGDKTITWSVRSWIGDRRKWWTDVTETR